MASPERKAKLPPLPPSQDDYWEQADVFVQPEQKRSVHEHFFIHSTAQEVQCKDCGIGFYLSPMWAVKEGKDNFCLNGETLAI